jgi:hydrophobic/amphiphilic exporter-1 (mainly G- bacteria), HAE1 family
MNISELFIRRPVMTTLVMAAILLVGIMAYFLLPVSDLPNVDFPTIRVSANLPGASPETMAAAVATPLEKQFSTISGIDMMTSTSTLGGTQITLQFNLARDIDAAAQDVQAAITQASRQLPNSLPSPPTYQKVNPADQPILLMALTSPTLPLSQLDEYGQTLMAQRISMVNGVAQVQVYGSQKYAVRIQVDPRALSSRGIGIDEVASAIDKGNQNLPTGTLQGSHRAFTVQASGQLLNAAAYRPLIVAYRAGYPVRLHELGRVIDSVENDKVAAWFVNSKAQQRSIILAVQRQPGTNTVEVAEAVKELLPTFTNQLPASVSLNMIYDRSIAIKNSVEDVKFTLLLTLVLVVFVIFLFLRSFSATVIPSLTLPMSIIGTFAVMYLLGYNLDNLSLMALTLSVGFVVDDAIVMLENIVRHMEISHKPALQASLDGSREIGFTIISMTLSLAAVFIPVLFMGGIVGRLFREFSVTIGAAVLVSGVISLTLTPMMCSRFLRDPESIHHGRIYLASEWVFQAILKIYEVSLRWVLKYKRSTMAVSVVILVATGFLFAYIPKGFLPSEDQDQIIGSTEAIEGISFQFMREHQQAVAAILQKDPNIDSFMSSIGSRSSNTGNAGSFTIRLKPKSQRKLSADELVDVLRPKLNSIPGIRVYLQNPPPIQIGGRVSKSQYQYTLFSPNTQELYQYADKLQQKIRDLPDFLDVTSDLQIKNPQVNVDILRDKTAIYGVNVDQIENALYYAYGSRQISTILTSSNQYQVILELEPEYQLGPYALPELYIRSASKEKELVPLNAVANLSTGIGPLSVNHSGQLPSVTISFNLKAGVPLGDAVATVNDLARSILPSTISTNFQGTAQAFQSSLKGLGWLLLVAVLVIYIVLGILYESFIHPLTILSALPFAGFGALVTLMIFKVDLSIYAFVGIIMLIGLVKKNGIMMIDFAIEARKGGDKTPAQAIFEACLVRFRPIMMTTLAALMGGLPIAMGYGAGAESRRPLGLAVVGGLLFSQTLTLYVTPVFYVYMEALRKKLSRKPVPITVT